jgi:hypothetical protein
MLNWESTYSVSELLPFVLKYQDLDNWYYAMIMCFIQKGQFHSAFSLVLSKQQCYVLAIALYITTNLDVFITVPTNSSAILF